MDHQTAGRSYRRHVRVVKKVKNYFLNSKKTRTVVKNQTKNSFFLPTSTRLSSKIWKSCQVQGLIVGGGRAKWPIYHSYWLDFSMKLPLCLFFLFLAYFTSWRFFSIPILTGQGQITPKSQMSNIALFILNQITYFEVLWKCHQVTLSKTCFRLCHVL